MSEATQRDVDILLRLWEMHNAPEMQSARMWVFTEFKADSYPEFKRRYPPGSLEWRRFTSVYSMYELYGVLVSRGLLNSDLFFDLFGGINLLWDRLQPVLAGMRQEIDPTSTRTSKFSARAPRSGRRVIRQRDKLEARGSRAGSICNIRFPPSGLYTG